MKTGTHDYFRLHSLPDSAQQPQPEGCFSVFTSSKYGVVVGYARDAPGYGCGVFAIDRYKLLTLSGAYSDRAHRLVDARSRETGYRCVHQP